MLRSDKTAPENKTFQFYVKWLADNHYLPPNGIGWVDHIRDLGNEATHEIMVATQAEAEDVLHFTMMLLRYVFELPNMAPKGKKVPPATSP